MERLSILIPCYNEAEVFPLLKDRVNQLAERLQHENVECEIIAVDDGSRDLTWALIREWTASNPDVRGIALSRNFGHQVALSCAYQQCTGDAAVSIDADLQDPPELIVSMVEKWRAGADVVFAIRRKRESESLFKRFTAMLYYRILGMLGLSFIEKDCGDFRLMSRRALDALNSMPEQNRLLRGMAGWIGFKTDKVYFERPPRQAGTTKYPLRKMLLLGADGIVSFSNLPLRATYLVGLFIMLIVASYLVWTTVMYILGKTPLVPGWSSLLITISAFGFANLICLGVIGEYIGRIYSEVKHRPLYLIRDDTKESSK